MKFQIGDLVQPDMEYNIEQRKKRYKAEQLYKPNNVYGIITELSKGYYDDKVIYYTVMWLNTGESYKYEAEELIKVS
jgi:hypothetical protein